ncbi:MAG: Asp-tRNA(Asn)/Glu-tRNA(Gln) amidotransferase subunit GatC [Phycisphaeraceae bacterium]|nr:MAG: Asp-tRNA(Asn)/Glu-tRNA(Gln) amidotransferase subunit GatC [Phycisphaeraceae bacterium]
MARPTLTNDDVRRIARLSKLELDDAQIETERERLAAVLGYVERLRELDLLGVEPMARASEEGARLRDDTPGEALDPGVAGELAPEVAEFHDAEGGVQRYIKVPKVLGEGGA